MSTDSSGSLLAKELPAKVVAIITPGSTLIDGTISGTFLLQIRIDSLHEGIPDAQLPYAALKRRSFVGASANVGWFSIPRVGSYVAVSCDGGDEKSFFVSAEYLAGNTLLSGFTKDDYGYIDQHGNLMKVDSAGNFLYQTTAAQNITYNSASGVITLQAGANTIVLSNDGTCTVHTASKVTLDTPLVEVTGNLQVDGNISGQGNLAVSGTSALTGDATFSGNASIGGTLTADGGNYANHTHGGVQGGTGTTGPVIP